MKIYKPVPFDYEDPDGKPAQKCSICENSASIGESLYFGGPDEMMFEYPFCKYCADNIPSIIRFMIDYCKKNGQSTFNLVERFADGL